jgi:electron-transferring-flavoprotein dehydrogenase
VYLARTKQREDEPCHLHLKDPELAISVNYKIYDSPETRYCPAGVYEIVFQGENPRLQINAPNCIHCKTCDIKDPTQNIVWEPPEGGEGPDFIGM